MLKVLACLGLTYSLRELFTFKIINHNIFQSVFLRQRISKNQNYFVSMINFLNFLLQKKKKKRNLFTKGSFHFFLVDYWPRFTHFSIKNIQQATGLRLELDALLLWVKLIILWPQIHSTPKMQTKFNLESFVLPWSNHCISAQRIPNIRLGISKRKRKPERFYREKGSFHYLNCIGEYQTVLRGKEFQRENDLISLQRSAKLIIYGKKH